MMEQLEGRICVEAALNARYRKIKLVLIRSGIHPESIQLILEETEKQHIPVKYVTEVELSAMAHGRTHGGIIALASPKLPISTEKLFELLKNSHNPAAMLLLEGVDDSQNFGFTLRSAEAMGMDAILLKKHLWDFDNTAVSRASSGAYERMPILQIEQAEKILPKLKQLGIRLFGCIANVKKDMYDVDFTRPLILAIGGEKRGLSAATRSFCDTLIRIPMVSPIGSLSLSHSASIVMAEVMRQRMHRGEGGTPSVRL